MRVVEMHAELYMYINLQKLNYILGVDSTFSKYKDIHRSMHAVKKKRHKKTFFFLSKIVWRRSLMTVLSTKVKRTNYTVFATVPEDS